MVEDSKSLIIQAQNLDRQIDYWQFKVKCEKNLLDLAIWTVNKLVEEKKKIVEKLKNLDIIYLTSDYPQIHNANNNNNNNK